MRTGVCNGIVFYDFDVNSLDIKGIFEFMEQWFTEHGYPPKLIGYSAQGLPLLKMELHEIVFNSGNILEKNMIQCFQKCGVKLI